MNQTFTDFEFLIIDDASKDNSVNKIKPYNDPRIRLVENEKNFGLSKTLNKGIDLANGKYIARIDQDDLSLPKRLERQVKYLEDNPDICVVGTWWKDIDENNNIINNVRLPVEPFECAFSAFASGGFFIGHPCVMFRQREIKSIGGYSEEYEIAQDTHLWFRSLLKGIQFANIPEYLLYYRRHQMQGSNNEQTEKEHNLALANFLSDILLKNIDSFTASSYRPINFNDKFFNSENIENMLQQKSRVLDIYFLKYELSSIKSLRCILKLWESLLPLCTLKNTNRIKILFKNIIFCFKHLKKQLKGSVVFNIPYFIIFFLLLLKLPVAKFISNPIHFFKRVF